MESCPTIGAPLNTISTVYGLDLGRVEMRTIDPGGMDKPEASASTGLREVFLIRSCPTPGCKGRKVTVQQRKGLITGFACDQGCIYSSHRNAFTNEISHYRLEKFNQFGVNVTRAKMGMKIDPSGKPYTDWR